MLEYRFKKQILYKFISSKNHHIIAIATEAVACRCSAEKVFSKISQNL